jgi:hypothetical protein
MWYKVVKERKKRKWVIGKKGNPAEPFELDGVKYYDTFTAANKVLKEWVRGRITEKLLARFEEREAEMPSSEWYGIVGVLALERVASEVDYETAERIKEIVDILALAGRIDERLGDMREKRNTDKAAREKAAKDQALERR